MGAKWFSDVSNIESVLAILAGISVKLGLIAAAAKKYLENRKSKKDLDFKDLVQVGMEIQKSLSNQEKSKKKKD